MSTASVGALYGLDTFIIHDTLTGRALLHALYLQEKHDWHDSEKLNYAQLLADLGIEYTEIGDLIRFSEFEIDTISNTIAVRSDIESVRTMYSTYQYLYNERVFHSFYKKVIQPDLTLQ